MRRNFPFVLQYDSMQCGVACLAMICSYFKKDKSMNYLSEQCFATTEGVSLLAIDKVASQLGLETKVEKFLLIPSATLKIPASFIGIKTIL